MQIRRPNIITRAFTLIELLVVISIIVVLVGVVLAVGTAVGAASDRSRTESTMKILEGALSEWESKSNRMLTWGTDVPVNGERYDLQADTMHVFLITEMLGTVARSSDVRDLVTQIDDEHLITYRPTGTAPEWVLAGGLNPDPYFEPDINRSGWAGDWPNWVGGLVVLDAWDRPIRFVHPGRKWTPADSPAVADADGTVRTAYENDYGVCTNARPYFVSSGPDRSFGDLQLEIAPGSRDPDYLEVANDNIYSGEVQKQ